MGQDPGPKPIKDAPPTTQAGGANCLYVPDEHTCTVQEYRAVTAPQQPHTDPVSSALFGLWMVMIVAMIGFYFWLVLSPSRPFGPRGVAKKLRRIFVQRR